MKEWYEDKSYTINEIGGHASEFCGLRSNWGATRPVVTFSKSGPGQVRVAVTPAGSVPPDFVLRSMGRYIGITSPDEWKDDKDDMVAGTVHYYMDGKQQKQVYFFWVRDRGTTEHGKPVKNVYFYVFDARMTLEDFASNGGGTGQAAGGGAGHGPN